MDPQTKAAKKYVGKKKKEAGSEENLETSTSVCKQTCNVVVKRIEEESKIPQCKEEFTPKQHKLKEKLIPSKASADLQGAKDTELSENTPSPLNSSKGHGDSLLDVCVCDNKDKQCSDESETKKVKGKVKEIEDRETTTVFSKTSDRKQKQGPSRTVDSEDEEHLGTKTICDSHVKVDANSSDSDSASTLSNGIVNCTSPSDSNQHPDRCSKNEDIVDKVAAKTEFGTNFVNEKSEISPAFRETLHEKESSANNPVIGVDDSDSKPEEDMHYKKQIIRAGSNNSPSHNNTQATAISQCIDINRSLTDQLSKTKSSEKYSLKEDGKSKPEAGEIMEKTSSSNMVSSYNPPEIERPEGKLLTKTHEVNEDRQSAFTCVQPSVSRSNPATPAALDRTDSRASDSQLSVHISDDKLSGSRCDEVRCIRSSPRTSPLVSDRHEAVNPYRDPELMRKNPVQSSVQNILAAQHKMSQSAFPSVHAPIPGATASSSQVPATFAGVQTLPAGSLLSTLPYTNAHQLTAPLTHHLALPHGYSMDAVVRAQHLAALQQQHHLLGLTLGSAPTMATLEALWQHKFPTTPLPTPYMLAKNQDLILPPDLASAIHREHFHLQLDHERRELERLEIERRERLEQELREKERKEILER